MSNQLYSLEERMDAQLSQFALPDDYYSTYPVVSPQYRDRLRKDRAKGVAVGVGALGAAAAGSALYKNREAIQAGAKDAARTGLKKAGRGAGLASNALHQSALKSGGLKMRAAGAGSNVLQKIATGARKVAKSFEVCDTATANRIVELAARINEMEDEIREFGGDTRQRDPIGVQAAGQYANGFLGGREALLARDKFAEKGHVYRKRDAARDGIKGSIGGTALAGGAIAGGVLGSRAIIKGAASGKLPKGALRKGAVKLAQGLKKAGRSPGVAVGGVLAGALGGQIVGSRIQRKSADKRLAKRQAEG